MYLAQGSIFRKRNLLTPNKSLPVLHKITQQRIKATPNSIKRHQKNTKQHLAGIQKNNKTVQKVIKQQKGAMNDI